MKTKRLLSLMLALLMLTACFLTSCGGDKKFDYTKEDLTKYLSFTSDAWTNQTVTIEEPDKVDQTLIDNYVRYYLSQCSVEVFLDDKTVEEDDVLALYYRGTIMEDGKEKDILGNFSTSETQYDMTTDVLGLGDDFTKGLIGIGPEHTLEALTSGKIEKDHVLYVTYSYNYKYKSEGKDGAEVEKWKTVKQETAVRFDLAELAESNLYGDGFVDKIVGKSIGSHTIETVFDANNDGVDDNVTFNLNITRAHKENPVSFKVTYPSDYSLESVKGKEVTFYVCVNGIAGTADELLTEEVLKSDKIKYTPAEDDEYKDDLVKSFLNAAEKYLIEDRENTIRTNALSALWDAMLEKATVIKYPQQVVDDYYNSMLAELTAYYEQYSTQAAQDTSMTKYSSLQDFAEVYYGVGSETDYKTYLQNQSKDAVKYNLAYYIIVREAKLEVTDKEYEEHYQEYIDAIIYQEQSTYYQNYGEWVDISEQDLLESYGKDYIESYIRQSLLTEELNEYLFKDLTVEFKTEEKK